MKPRRVVITGLGALTPIGNTLRDYWNGLVEGRSGAAPITYFDASKFKTQFACELKNFDPLNFFEKKDIRKYVKTLEAWMIKSLKYIGLSAYTCKDRIGIWVNGPHGESKIGAIGIRVSHWITYHGISLNINPNLDYYKSIIPCGIKDLSVTSLKELGYNYNMNEFDEIIKKSTKDIF